MKSKFDTKKAKSKNTSQEKLIEAKNKLIHLTQRLDHVVPD